MLDQDVKQELKQVFSNLENKVGLHLAHSLHADQTELTEMLRDLASVSDKIEVITTSDFNTPLPCFKIIYQGKPSGITFTGIPGGHEFSSLVVAILNVDGKGKMPDPLLQQRIRRIKGPIHVRTFISLSCENCPDVVQMLNQMAIIHGNFFHEMVDGGLVQDEIERLKVQGVPSVFSKDDMVSSGKISLLDMIQKLEERFGIDESSSSQAGEQGGINLDLGSYDVAVIGGGPAATASAIYAARKGLKTVILAERMGGQVQDTLGIENLISVVYTEGPKLAAQLADHIRAYPSIRVLEHRRVKSVVPGEKKKIELESQETLIADSVIVASGAKWRELGVPGEKDYIGRGVAFCPHCDGPFYKGKKVAVIGGGNSGVEAAIDLAGIVGHVVVIEFNPALKADKVLVDKLLSLKNVEVRTNVLTEEILGNGAKVTGLKYKDRATNENVKLELDGVFVQIGLIPNSQFLKGVVELSKYGEVIIDEKCRTSQKGIYAAGDVTTTPYKQIIIAMGEGAKAALAAFEDRMTSHA